MRQDGNGVVLGNAADDARLIAAAPELLAERDKLRAVNADLLAALLAIEAWPEIDPGFHFPAIHKYREIARAAIKNAAS